MSLFVKKNTMVEVIQYEKYLRLQIVFPFLKLTQISCCYFIYLTYILKSENKSVLCIGRIVKIVSSLVALVISVKERMHATFSRFEGLKSYFIISTFHHVWLPINVVWLELYIALVWAVKLDDVGK